MKNFQKITSDFNVAPLLEQLDKEVGLWDRYTLRTTHPGTVHGDVSDIWLRFNDLRKYPVEELHKIMDDLDCIDYAAYEVLTAAKEVVEYLVDVLAVTKVGRVLITKLPPGGKIAPHVDEGAYAEHYNRYHCTLKNEEGSTFRCGDEIVYMKPGDIYCFDASKEHEIINDSNEDRITMIIDAV